MNREKLEKIGIAATLVSAAVGLYLYHQQEQAAANAAAAAAQTTDTSDLADPLGDASLFSQPQVLGDSTENDSGGITLPSVPDYGDGGGGGTSGVGTTSTAPPTQVSSLPPATGVTGVNSGVGNTHTQPVSVSYNPNPPASTPASTAPVVKPIYTVGNSHTTPVAVSTASTNPSTNATRQANFNVAHPNVINASY